MIRLYSWAAGLAAVAALLAGVWWHGHAAGVRAEAARGEAARAALQASLFDLADRHSAAAADLARLQAAQDAALKGFEDDAAQDPAATDRRADPDELREVRSLWRRARAAP